MAAILSTLRFQNVSTKRVDSRGRAWTGGNMHPSRRDFELLRAKGERHCLLLSAVS